jgi:hypothetical protein
VIQGLYQWIGDLMKAFARVEKSECGEVVEESGQGLQESMFLPQGRHSKL